MGLALRLAAGAYTRFTLALIVANDGRQPARAAALGRDVTGKRLVLF
jgi:hypothetical protein